MVTIMPADALVRYGVGASAAMGLALLVRKICAPQGQFKTCVYSVLTHHIADERWHRLCGLQRSLHLSGRGTYRVLGTVGRGYVPGHPRGLLSGSHTQSSWHPWCSARQRYMYRSINPMWPSEAIWHWTSWSSIGSGNNLRVRTKPLPESMLIYCQLDCTNFSEILNKTPKFCSTKMHFKMSSAKCLSLCYRAFHQTTLSTHFQLDGN